MSRKKWWVGSDSFFIDRLFIYRLRIPTLGLLLSAPNPSNGSLQLDKIHSHSYDMLNPLNQPPPSPIPLYPSVSRPNPATTSTSFLPQQAFHGYGWGQGPTVLFSFSPVLVPVCSLFRQLAVIIATVAVGSDIPTYYKRFLLEQSKHCADECPLAC